MLIGTLVITVLVHYYSLYQMVKKPIGIARNRYMKERLSTDDVGEWRIRTNHPIYLRKVIMTTTSGGEPKRNMFL